MSVTVVPSDGVGLPSSMVERGGAGVRVAVIDSGWSGLRPDARVANEQSLLGEHADAKDGAAETAHRWHPHGERCASIVLQVVPRATVLPIRVFDAYLRTSPAAVVEAINRACEQGVHVINLSLTMDAPEVEADVIHACEQAESQGILVVAASHNAGTRAFPAELPTVLGARAISTASLYQYAVSPSRAIQCFAHGQFAGAMRNSYATAVMSGLVAAVRSYVGAARPTAIRELLYAYADARISVTDAVDADPNPSPQA